MQKNIKISEDNRGFSLLELIVTVVILAIVTAPFLSSFVTASNTNVKSKRIQEANELSQYVIEQCKAMSLDKIENEYGTATSWNKDTAQSIDDADSSYDKSTIKYKWTIDGANLPTGYSDNYTADVEIKPIKAIINSNEAIPVVDDVNKKSCTVLKDKINKCNLMPAYSGSKKHLTVTLSKDTDPAVVKKYKVNYKVRYTDLSGATELVSYEETFAYEYIPDVYLLYATMNSQDTIAIVNDIPEADFISAGKQVNVYIMEQDWSSSHQMSVENVKFKEDSGEIGLNLLMYGDDSIKLKNTVIYTNITYSSSGSTIIKDKDDTVNNTLKNVKIDTLYDISVKINYAGKEVSTIKATKVKMQ